MRRRLEKSPRKNGGNNEGGRLFGLALFVSKENERGRILFNELRQRLLLLGADCIYSK